MQTTEDEVASQPRVWRHAATLVDACRAAVPHGERVAFIGCGTSWFVAQAVAALRESSGFGESDAFAASEALLARGYDRVVAISRSGTTTEVARALHDLPAGLPSVAIVAAHSGPVVAAADATIVLDFADEQSIVQTRFATGVLAMFRSAFGHDMDRIAAEAQLFLDTSPSLAETPYGADLLVCRRFVFLGHGWTVGLAHEAALKLREAALAATESYPAMEYRHGPIALAEPGTAVWWLGPADADLVSEVAALGATVIAEDADPLVALVAVHLLALGLARREGLDPDTPRNLSRSVILEPAVGGAR
jgi:fructoselysine-6-P-deglycase FrlB-like protein